MDCEYDVVIIGGAFSGAATALLLKRKLPTLRILILEKSVEFDRKVGESTTEVSSCFLTRILGLSTYLGQNQLLKQGLRLWFCKDPAQAFDDCVEIGARYQARLPTFQVDRSQLDTHLLSLASQAGCTVWKPAKLLTCDLDSKNGTTVTVFTQGETKVTRCKWVVDASGRAAFLARKLGHFRANTEHPINAVWARFTGVKDWDSYEWRERFPAYAAACRTGRSWATNHLMGYGWWCWIIPLKGGDYSAGLVYDSRLFKLPAGLNLGARLKAHLLSHPVGREIFGEAQFIESDVKAYSAMPYSSEMVCGQGWVLAGDAAGFIDPLYSPGLDMCSYTVSKAVDLVSNALGGLDVSSDAAQYNAQFRITYRYWFETLYRDKYYYLGDAELMSAALLLDVGSYFVGLVRPVYADPEAEFLNLPFAGAQGRIFGGFMKLYNRRLSVIAQRRFASGTYGKANAAWRELYDGFVPDFRVRKLIYKGLLRWWKAELSHLALTLRSRQADEMRSPASAKIAEV